MREAKVLRVQEPYLFYLALQQLGGTIYWRATRLSIRPSTVYHLSQWFLLCCRKHWYLINSAFHLSFWLILFILLSTMVVLKSGKCRNQFKGQLSPRIPKFFRNSATFGQCRRRNGRAWKNFLKYSNKGWKYREELPVIITAILPGYHSPSKTWNLWSKNDLISDLLQIISNCNQGNSSQGKPKSQIKPEENPCSTDIENDQITSAQLNNFWQQPKNPASNIPCVKDNQTIEVKNHFSSLVENK